MATVANDVENVTTVKGSIYVPSKRERKTIEELLRNGANEREYTLTAVVRGLLGDVATLPKELPTDFNTTPSILLVKSQVRERPTYGAENTFDSISLELANGANLESMKLIETTRGTVKSNKFQDFEDAKATLIRVYGSTDYNGKDKKSEYLCTFELPESNKRFSFVPTLEQFEAIETYFLEDDFDDEKAVEIIGEIKIKEGSGRVPNYAILDITPA